MRAVSFEPAQSWDCTNTHTHKEPTQCTKPLMSSFDFKVKWHLWLLKLTCLHLFSFFFSLFTFTIFLFLSHLRGSVSSPSPLPLSFSNVRANFKLQTPANTLRGVHWESLFQTVIISPTNWQIPHTFDCVTIKRLLQPKPNTCYEFSLHCFKNLLTYSQLQMYWHSSREWPKSIRKKTTIKIFSQTILKKNSFPQTKIIAIRTHICK